MHEAAFNIDQRPEFARAAEVRLVGLAYPHLDTALQLCLHVTKSRWPGRWDKR